MNIINGENKRVAKIYRGGELVWEAPEVMMSELEPYSGMRTLIFHTYPGKCRVRVTLNKKIIFDGISAHNGYFTCTPKEPLKSRDFIKLIISKDGWKDLTNRYFID